MKISGIYKIESKRKPERCYIGSAKDIHNRWKTHLRDLRLNKHHSKKLQRHVNKYGIEDLAFSILLGCDVADLLKHEQYFLDSLETYFNTCKIAGSVLGVKRGNPWNTGKKMSVEYRKRLSDAHKGQPPWNKGKKTDQTPWNKGLKGAYTFKMPEEAKRKIALAAIGNKNALGVKHSEQARQNMRRAAQNRILSDEQREASRLRLIEANKKRDYRGREVSMNTRIKISNSLKKYNKDKKLKIAS